jgi:deoxyribodipyrimidine photolyase
MRNTHINTDQKKGYTNFLRFTKKMVMIKHQLDYLEASKAASQLKSLREQINNTENVINKFWLEEECGAFETP